MIDMCGEEEAILQPHSQVRHELMHNQYNKMKEEEDHWQDVSVAVLSNKYSVAFLIVCVHLCFYKCIYFFAYFVVLRSPFNSQ